MTKRNGVLMASTAAELRVSDLPLRQVSALKRKAGRLGLTAEDYIKRLIKEDLALDRRAATTSLSELSRPFRKALSGLDDREIELIVRTTRAKGSNRKR